MKRLVIAILVIELLFSCKKAENEPTECNFRIDVYCYFSHDLPQIPDEAAKIYLFNGDHTKIKFSTDSTDIVNGIAYVNNVKYPADYKDSTNHINKVDWINNGFARFTLPIGKYMMLIHSKSNNGYTYYEVNVNQSEMNLTYSFTQYNNFYLKYIP